MKTNFPCLTIVTIPIRWQAQRIICLTVKEAKLKKSSATYRLVQIPVTLEVAARVDGFTSLKIQS